MTGRLKNIMFPAVLLAAVLAGCQAPQREEKTLYNPLADPNISMPDYAARAIEAAGGSRAWMQTEKLDLDCVVTFYQPDGSFYLTEQHHQIQPWRNSIRISAAEPQGRLVWELDRADVKDGKPAYTGAAVPGCLSDMRHFAQLILDVTTAPVRFLDRQVQFSRGSSPLQAEGAWYQLIERSDESGTGVLSNAIFYQNTHSSMVDRVGFPDIDNGRLLIVRAYDYRPIEKSGVRLPGKVEIFESDAGASLKARLAEINYRPVKAGD
ncbi:MAG: hypothetical protein ACYTBJ_07590 [Planctomycetota bacterium]|jgi:hypothetical protein